MLTTLPTQSDEPSTSSNPGFAVPVTKMISLEDPTVIHILQHIHEMSLSSSNKNVNTSKKKKGKGLREKPDNMKDGEEIKKEITLPPKPSHETKTSAIDKNVNPTRERKVKKSRTGDRKGETRFFLFKLMTQNQPVYHTIYPLFRVFRLKVQSTMKPFILLL